MVTSLTAIEGRVRSSRFHREGWQVGPELLSDPAARQAGKILVADEKTFIDLARSPLWVNRENEIVKRGD